MISLIVALVGVCFLVAAGEYLRQVHLLHAEVTRKFIHITVACFAASWPFFMEWQQVYLISLLMLVGILLSRFLHLFRAIHGVKRRTWGEVFFAVSIGLAALLSQNAWAFAAAMLVMGVADGFAALVGTLIDNTHRYHIFGHPKSREGTLTFFLMSLIILAVCVAAGHLPANPAEVLGIAVAVTILENISSGGTDNLFVPLVIIVLL
jgi:phytol kinase